MPDITGIVPIRPVGSFSMVVSGTYRRTRRECDPSQPINLYVTTIPNASQAPRLRSAQSKLWSLHRSHGRPPLQPFRAL